MLFHAATPEQLATELKITTNGLTTTQARERLEVYGPNILPRADVRHSRFSIFLSQWKNPLVIILFIAGTVSGIVGELTDMAIIYATVLINTLVGFIQEDKANQSLQKLSNMVDHSATILRDGVRQMVPARDIVPGDIMFVEAGDSVAADGRIVHAIECEINEAPLTGESMPVKKNVGQLSEKTLLADRTNMAYCGTTVANGKATVIVTATNTKTELGAIATLVKNTTEEDTPLQKEIARLARQIGLLVVGIVASMIIIGLFRVGDMYSALELFQTAVAVAVAAIPEGLAISLTVILAIGMQFILKRKGLVRQLVAAETLGSISVICTDKTGTLTEGIMQVTTVVTASETIENETLASLDATADTRHPDALLALRIGTMANNAAINHTDRPEHEWTYAGDTTEVAIIRSAQKAGIAKHHLDAAIPRVDEIPFTSERKFMATLHHVDAESHLYIKGAPEVILDRATWYEENGEKKPLTDDQRQWFHTKQKALARRGLRLLAIAYAIVDHTQTTIREKDISNLIIVGLIGLSDPIRPDVPATIARCRDAHIRVIMLTGDHRDTAQGIATAIGLPVTDRTVIDGQTLSSLSDTDLDAILTDAVVFARINPSDKIRVVAALQRQGEVVAVTGDGVNDAPAIKGANIGIAVGSGTAVAKETADLILLDDSFTTIVAAIEEGRRIYKNIKKVILYLLSGSFAEIVLIIASIIAKLPLPLLPAQILWVNIIQETFPTIALAFDPGEKENMREKPRRHDNHLIDRPMKLMIIAISLVANTLLFCLFVYIVNTTQNIAESRTMTFAGLTVASLFYVYAIRSERYHFWQKNPFDNAYLNSAVLFGIFLFFSAIYFPPLQTILKTVSLRASDWGILIIFALINVAAIEAVKTFRNHRRILSHL